MSQAGILSVEGSDPQVPTQFDANVGFAIPIGNVMEILAESVPAGSIPAQTVGSGNTITTEIQTSQAIAATDATKIGLAAFNSAQFGVDANGFVSLAGGGLAIDSVQVQTGTSPIGPTVAGLITINGSVVAAGTNPVRTNGTGPNTFAVEVQTSQALAAADATKIGLSNFDSSSFGVDADGFVTASGTGLGKTITGNTGGALSPTSGNWNIVGNNNALNGFASYATGTGSTLTMNSFGRNKWVVNPTAGLGTHTTIQAAVTAASTGDTVVITSKSTPYVEDITGKVGVNIVADTSDAFNGNVTISGTFSHNTSGTICVSGIRFQTNGAAAIAVTGSVASVLTLRDCYINCTNSTGIIFSSSSSAAQVILENCDGNLTTTGIKLFDHSASGILFFDNVNIGNTGSSTTPSTCSSGLLNMQHFNFLIPITTSGTANGAWEHGLIDTSSFNITSVTIGSGSGISMKWTRLSSGNASAASIVGLATMEFCSVSSSNTNALTGVGILSHGLITFTSSSSTVNVTTQSPLVVGPRISTPGITFDGNVNVLSAFSQGTFSPVVVGFSTAGAPTMTQQFGRYQRTGRYVTISLWVSWTTLGGATGAPTINNLPFTVVNNTSAQAPSFAASNSALALTTNAQAFMQPVVNSTLAIIGQSVGSATTAPSTPTITASNGFTTVLTYETA